ncbi:unnamed protein product [Amoebophrya sp. A120]|nr:unnamed protein product [Amoebophrya sp. A120]|eukprot:GSA120T00003381001.1
MPTPGSIGLNLPAEQENDKAKMTSGPSTLKWSIGSYAPAVDPTFWQELARLKLDEWRLDGDKPTELRSEILFAPSKASFSYNSFAQPVPPWQAGVLRNMSTIEEFRRYDRQDMLENAQKSLWGGLVKGELFQPSVFVTFADLKKYHFFYTLGFPFVKCPANPELVGREEEKDEGVLKSIKGFAPSSSSSSSSSKAPGQVGVRAFVANGSSAEEKFLVYFDSGENDTYDSGFRNVLTLLWLDGGKTFRTKAEGEGGTKFSTQCVVVQKGAGAKRLTVRFAAQPTDKDREKCPEKNFSPGWLKNEQGTSVVRQVDLAQWLNPAAIAKSAVDLNIKLMKWRLVPDLEPEKMQDLRFLMLGSGTLGCALARNLLGWGVRHITFLDSGIVNFSNPVRQSLFTHQDAVDQRPKAEAAFARAKDVMPELEGGAVQLEIPMPGHSHSYSEENIEKLQKLIDSHDVICMLTDSRESRWLPSLLVAASKRPVLGLTVALGFDSFLVMTQSCGAAKRACYFCNDVSAPTDSLKERTLDRQCTVVRPGVSGLASALASELVAALSQHPQGFEAQKEDSLLGKVPDQIRGYLSDYRLVPLETEPFAQCVCCSPQIRNAYETEGMGFIRKCVEDNRILEEVSGLNNMKSVVDGMQADALDLELDEEDEDLCVL